MTISLFSENIGQAFGKIGGSGLSKILESEGRMPGISIQIKPLSGAGGFIKGAQGVSGITIDRFTSYQFTSSILTPVDSFTFSFTAPDGPPLPEQIKDGDIIVLSANQVTIGTGIIDQTDVETDDQGERGIINGRDLMSQLEDQDAISLDSLPIWAEDITIVNGVKKLLDNTRITELIPRNVPGGSWLLGTEPGESKLAVLQRFLEPFSCLAWMSTDGKLIIGKPDMAQKAKHTLIISKEKRISNCLSMRVSRSSTQIPNAIIPVWTGQETTTFRIDPSQRLMNNAEGPSRLFKQGHRVPKTVIVSTPIAKDAQGFSETNTLIRAGGGDLLNAYAKREIARQNVNEMQVEVVVAGHFNESGEPFVTDTVYYIEYDRGKVYESMYLFQCVYTMSEGGGGQRTNLSFCRLGTIVADVVAP